MRVVKFSGIPGSPVELFDSVGASSVPLAAGAGEARVYSVRLDAGGVIGAHPAGFGQLFLVAEGRGWAAGADGQRVELAAGEGAFFARGELHSKGSEVGMTALMMQVTDLALADAESAPEEAP